MIGGGSIGQVNEGGDTTAGRHRAVGQGTETGLGDGNDLGKVGIGVAESVLGGDHRLGAEGRARNGSRRLGGKDQGCGGDIHRTA